MKCPVCKEELHSLYVDRLDGWCLLAEGFECINKHYQYHYDTGTTTVIVGGLITLEYYYDKGPTWLQKLYHKFVIWIARLKWKINYIRSE